MSHYILQLIILKKLKSKASNKDFEQFQREFKVMKQLNSLFIAKVYKMNIDKREYIMELLNTTLYDYIKQNNNKLNFQVRHMIIRQIIMAFQHLYKENIQHRDISPKNILLKLYNENKVLIKIADFGLVKLEIVL